MSKILILGDMHFCIKSSSHTLCMIHMKNMNKFLDDVLFPYIEANNIKIIWQTGDMFDNRKANSNIAVQNSKNKFFNRLEKLGVELHTIVGNHDMLLSNSTHINSLTTYLKEYKNVNIYSEPSTVDGVDFIPWICEDNVGDIMNYIENSKSKICVCHPEITGFNMNAYQQCEIGMDLEFFKNYDLVIAGHFHDTSRKSNVLYVGTPLRHNYGESTIDKGFWVLDKNTLSMEFIINPHNLYETISYNNDIEYKDTVTDKYITIELPDIYDEIKYKNFVKQLWEQEPYDIVSTSNKKLQEYDGASISLADIENKSFSLIPFLTKYTKSISPELDENVLSEIYTDIYSRSIKDN